MNGSLRWFAASGAMLVLAGCAITRSSVVVEPAPGVRPAGTSTAAATAAPAHARVPGGSYQVAHGDTLYSIAFRNGVDFRDLAGWNGIAAPYTIWPGQVLRLSPPARTASGGTAQVAAAPVPAPVHPASGAPPAPAAPVFESVAPASATASVPAPASSAVAKPPAGSATGEVKLPASSAAAAVPAPGSTTTVVPVAGVPTPKPAAVPAPPPVAAVPAGATRSAGGVVWRWPVQGKLIKGFRSGDAIPGIELAGKSGDPVLAAGDGVVVYSGNGLVGYGELIIIKHNDSFLSAYGHNRKRLVKEGQRVSAGQQIAELGSTGASHDALQFQIRRDGNPVDPLGYLPPR